MNKKYLCLGLFALSLLWACGSSSDSSNAAASADPNAAVQELFSSKCSMCHDFKEDKIGPALAGVQQRWGNDPQKLKTFIRNSQAFIETGDPYAVALYEKWNKAAMPSFTDINEEEMNKLIAYLNQ